MLNCIGFCWICVDAAAVRGDLGPVQSLSEPGLGGSCLSALLAAVMHRAHGATLGTDHGLLQQVKSIEVTAKDPQHKQGNNSRKQQTAIFRGNSTFR